MEFRLFGQVTVVGDHGEFGLGNGRPAAILGLLLIEAGRVVTLDRLVEDLWGEEKPTKGAHAVRVYVSRLRSSLAEAGLDEPIVVAKAGGYAADVPRAAVDIHRFEDLVSRAAVGGDPDSVLRDLDDALNLWVADPLAGFRYDDFAVRTRRRLLETRLDAGELWAEAALDAGRSADVVSFLAPLLEEHQFRERLWASLAIALYREQRQTDALRSIEAARSALREAGLDIGTRLVDLESSILLHEPTLELRHDPPHNLPAKVDAFIGRGREISQIEATLRSARLASLVGPGGCGKTRLAVEASWHLLDGYDRRVWLVDLAAVDSQEAIPDTAIEALGLGPWPGAEPIRAVSEVIGDRPALLVLDNCEHLIDAVASFGENLLRRCPELRIIATTREPLRIAGESLITVPSLMVPPEGTALSDLDEFEATALFLDRTRNANPGLELTDDIAPAVIEIVRMLDGIPLAIELAAVRVRTLPLPEIASRLDHLLSTLGVGSRTALPRHRTLEAALDWSMDLLDDDEKELFCRLGVLRSDFGLDAAAAVAGISSPEVVESLVFGLVEKSMVVSTGRNEARYRLLEPIRQYAAARLLETKNAVQTNRRRDDFYSALAVEAGNGVRRFEDPHWKHRFGRERPNLLTSVESLLEQGETDRAAVMTSTIARYWLELGLYDEGKRLIRSVLHAQHPASTEMRLGLMVAGAFLGAHQGDYDTTDEWAGNALSLAERHDSPEIRSSALNALGSVAADRGNMRLAANHLTEARQTSGPSNPGVYLPSTVNLAAVNAWAGNVDAADRLIDELKELPGAGAFDLYVVALRGIVARMRGSLDDAGETLDRAIEELEDRGSAFHLALLRTERAIVAFEKNNRDLARNLTRIVMKRTDAGTSPLWARMRSRLLAARLASTEGAIAAGHAVLVDAVNEAEATGTVGVIAEAADVAGHMALESGDRLHAARLIHSGTALRHELEYARDGWERDVYDRTLSRLDGADADGPPNPDPRTLAGLIRRHI